MAKGRPRCTFCGLPLPGNPSGGEELYCRPCFGEGRRPRPLEVASRPWRLKSGADLTRESHGELRTPRPRPIERRPGSRYAPPGGSELSVKRGGRRLFPKNILLLWVDVSSAGLRAIVSGNLAVGESCRASIRLANFDYTFLFRLRARTVRPSENIPGCSFVGFDFENPPPVVRCLYRDKLSLFPFWAWRSRPLEEYGSSRGVPLRCDS